VSFSFPGEARERDVGAWAEGELGEANGEPDSAVDFEAVKAVVDATHRYKEIFYAEQ
jgi:hypothetical protein